MEYWKGDITQWDVEKLRMHDSGHGIVLTNKVRACVVLGPPTRPVHTLHTLTRTHSNH